MNSLDDVTLRDLFASASCSTDDSNWADVISRAGLAPSARARRLMPRRADFAFAVPIVLLAAAVVALALRLHTATAASPPGPTKVERHVGNGTIRWLIRHQAQGQSLAGAKISLGSTVGAHWQPVRFARVLQPDPKSNVRVVVSLIGTHGRNICMTVFVNTSSFGGCGIGRGLKPFSVSTASGPDLVGPGGGLLLAGLASDEVTRLELFLPHGRQQAVPLTDNTFAVRVRGSDPVANLVAYDKHGLVIGTTTARHVVLMH